MEKENSAFKQQEDLKKIKQISKEQASKFKQEQFAILTSKINPEMKRINNIIYDGIYNSPTISFTDNSYSFFTPNDTGTGIAYKGLVVFDISVCNLTALPILVHDSVLLKQISDSAINRILKQYINTKKQVIIALDKQNSYGQDTSELLEKYAILKLSPNGNELFGRSWGQINNEYSEKI